MDVDRRSLMDPWWGRRLAQPGWKGLKALKNRPTPYNPAIRHQGTYPKEFK